MTNILQKIKLYWDFTRPFTLIPPALGFLSGGLTAIGARAHANHVPFSQAIAWSVDTRFLLTGALMAATLNAASNVLNQITDLELDKINKPNRPLCKGIISIHAAWVYTLVLYLVALLLAWLTAPEGRRECFWLVLIAAIATYIYSAPPLRTKRLGIWANVTIAIPRGMLLKMAGWSAAMTIFKPEAWFIGGIFGLFLLGASTTKDFADMKGDKAFGCMTLPILYGVKRTAWMISPSFVIPWLLIPLGVSLKILTGNPIALWGLGILLTLWGMYVVYLMVRRPEELATTENHVSWVHMYRMMMLAQIGFALSYML